MALNIKNARAERLARELAAATGESLTEAVTTALSERLERVHAADEAAIQARIERIMEIAKDAGPRWVEPWKSTPHGDLLYDELGLPK